MRKDILRGMAESPVSKRYDGSTPLPPAFSPVHRTARWDFLTRLYSGASLTPVRAMEQMVKEAYNAGVKAALNRLLPLEPSPNA